MRHYIGTIEDSDVKAYCFMNDQGLIVACESIANNDEKFFAEVERVKQFYNAVEMVEPSVESLQKLDDFGNNIKHKLVKIPHISTAVSDYCKTEKGKKALAVWLF